MGMIDWLLKTEVEHAKYSPEDRGLPTPTRPAPPMPKCEPPYRNPAPVMAISEPVITLLAELEKDVWEVTQDYDIHLSRVDKSTSLQHVYNSGLCVSWKGLENTYLRRDIIKRVLLDWLTKDEAEVVLEALIKTTEATLYKNVKNFEEIIEYRKSKSRAIFSKQIGAPIDNN